MAVPTRRSQLLFEAKAALLRIPRLARDSVAPPRLGRQAASIASMGPIATSISPLWAGGEAALTAGKVQNLRLAARAIDGRAFEAGEVFSFWRHVGRPSARRGFALGRELREGCLVPSVGGGLCQLSNALYDAALEAGFEIVERHAHTAKVPGSLAELGRDATVFWNYVDLRFRASRPFAIEARLTARELIVRLLASPSAARPRPTHRPLGTLPERTPSSCTSCGRARCPSNAPHLARARFGRTAFLVDRAEPELARWVSAARADRDVILLPIDPRLVPRARYAWPADFASVRQAILPTLARSIASRRLAAQGAARQRALLAHDARLAAWMAARLTAEDTHLVVAQTLLPFLWQLGVLGGRTFDVLASRLPMSALHARLDRAREQIPRSPTLADFRAPASLVRAEDEALGAASRVITAHTDIAALFGERAERLPWSIPSAAHRARGGDAIVFLGPVVARRGVHLLREAMREVDRPLVVPGRDLEGGFDWGRPVDRSPIDPLEGAAAVVLPAWVEHSPRDLLRAAARGVPVLASAACGLEGVAGVRTIPTGDVRALGQAIRALSLSREEEAQTHAGR